MKQEATTQFAQAAPVSATNRRRAAIDVAVGYALILAVIWTPRPLQRWLWIVAIIGVALLIWKSFPGWKAMGFTTANLGRSLWIVGVALLIAAAAIVVAARMHTLLRPSSVMGFVAGYFAYAVWTCVQQFLLQGFFLLRLVRVIPKAGFAGLTAAALFASAHLPNPILTPITLVWGFAACLLFVRYRNIYPLMIAHAILGIAVAMTIPGPVDHNMRVGLGYLTYNRYARLHSHRFRPYREQPRPAPPPSTQP